MDYALRCNELKCRKQLDDQALVTTCSHIFCLECARALGCLSSNVNSRTCPACDATLRNPDDAVITSLNPSEDYKTSVLSGLSPSIIMECAGRGLAFYSYQATQEITYQEHMTKSLSEKHSLLSSHLDRIIHDANAEITSLRSRISGEIGRAITASSIKTEVAERLIELQIDHDSLRTKNHEMSNTIMEKARAHAKTQRDFDNLKKQMLQHDVRSAAAEAADWTPSASTRSQRASHSGGSNAYRTAGNANRQHMGQIHRHQRSGSSSSGERLDIGDSIPRRKYAQPIWNNQENHVSSTTPMQYRTRLPMTDVQSQKAPAHAPLGPIPEEKPRQVHQPIRYPLGTLQPNFTGNASGSVFQSAPARAPPSNERSQSGSYRHPNVHIPYS